MKKKTNHRKFAALLVSLCLLLTTALAGTIAFLVAGSETVVNTFEPSEVTCKVEETITNNVKSNVTVKNTGDTDAWIRASVVVTWQDEKGNVYGQAPVANTDYTITYNVSKNIGKDVWVKGTDGFYYWTSPVPAVDDPETKEVDETLTGVLITSCSYNANAPEGYHLAVEIIGSGIQSKPASVFNTEWASSGLKVNDSNTDPMQWTLVSK